MAAMLADDRARASDLAQSVVQRRAALATAEADLLRRARGRAGLGDDGQRPAGSLSPAAHHTTAEGN
jgi:hypothetical protein